MSIVAIVFEVLLFLAFLLTGGSKLAGAKWSLERRDHLHVAPWFWRVTGGIEVLGGILVLVGIWVPPLAFIGALLIAATMIGAVYTEVINKAPFQQAIPGLVLFVLALVVILARWSDLPHLLG